MQLAWAVVGGLLDYLIGLLEDVSREYREVSTILDKEKEIEKQKLTVSTVNYTAYILVEDVRIQLSLHNSYNLFAQSDVRNID